MSAPTNVETGYADINGARLYYEVAGQGHPLALLHFGLGDSRFWDDQFPVFAQRYRVLRYDQRGFGRSSMPASEYSFRDDLAAMLRHFEMPSAYVVGCSMGGGLAIDFTLEHPEMVDALIPVAPGLSGFEWSDEDAKVFQEIEAAVKAGDLDRANELELRLWVDGPRRTPDQVSPAVREKVREMNAILFRRHAEMEAATSRQLDPPAAGRLGEIHVPTLLIIGDEDVHDLQRAADFIVEHIPGARKAVMHNVAHAPNMEQPEEFNRIALDFLAGLG